jgi:endonuclease-8
MGFDEGVPEGHSIHHCAAVHAATFGGQRVRVSSPQGRFPDASLVDGQVFTGTDAWGKHLFHEYDNGLFVHVHLGIYGTFNRHDLPAPEPRPTTRMRMVGTEAVVDLIGPITCEVVDDVEPIVAKLGPDPLRRDADPERAWQRLQRRRIPIGQALLDQSVIAGVGNVYRAEALFTHRIHPLRPANELTHNEFLAVWKTLVRLMRKGVRDMRIATRNVYRRDTCPECGTAIHRWDLAGRWAYACPSCQV